MAKELRLNLDYLASTYGIDLDHADLAMKGDGTWYLVLHAKEEAEKKDV